MRSTCPACGSTFELDSRLSGTEMCCGACGQVFVVASNELIPQAKPVLRQPVVIAQPPSEPAIVIKTGPRKIETGHDRHVKKSAGCLMWTLVFVLLLPFVIGGGLILFSALIIRTADLKDEHAIFSAEYVEVSLEDFIEESKSNPIAATEKYRYMEIEGDVTNIDGSADQPIVTLDNRLHCLMMPSEDILKVKIGDKAKIKGRNIEKRIGNSYFLYDCRFSVVVMKDRK